MPLPEIEYLLLKTPLYDKIEIREEDVKVLQNFLLNTNDTIDTFCPSCNKVATFNSVYYEDITHHYAANNHFERVYHVAQKFQQLINKYYTISFKCSRDNAHCIAFSFILTNEYLMKVGQYPSIADSSLPEYKKYKKVLGDDLHKEFTKGIGLVSHGIGAGSFVYLRRSFEYLIEEAHKEASGDEGWSEEKYIKSRMDEKINLLTQHLPDFLVENRTLYSILSKGIHELSEKECLEYFEPVKIAIQLILDEKIEMMNKKKRIEDAKAAIGRIHSDLSK